MTTAMRYGAASAAIFVWIGCVFAISFMEAWLKFKGPGVTLPIGLGIGRIVFGALNRVEWALAVAVTAFLLSVKPLEFGQTNAWLGVGVTVLLVETVWLLPALDRRAVAYIAGENPPGSLLHLVFIAAEVIKVACLVMAGIHLLRKI